MSSVVTGPPAWIPKGTVARLVLQDPKPSVHGSEGTVTYNYSDATLTVSNAWSTSVPGGGHPLFVGYVTGGGQPS